MNDYIHLLMQLQFKYKAVHWYTNNYQVHLATDKFNDSSRGLFDEMIETAQGIENTPAPSKVIIEVAPGGVASKLYSGVTEDLTALDAHTGKFTAVDSQIDQLKAYLLVLRNNLSMIKD